MAAVDENHAVVVGIDHYNGGIRALQGSLNDCDLFIEWLRDPQGGNVPAGNLIDIRSAADAPGQPFGEHIEMTLEGFFNRSLQVGRPVGNRLYLFFAGHGVTKDLDRTALVTANAALTFVRGFIGDLASAKIRTSGLFREVILVMDCCRDVFEPSRLNLRCELPDMTDITRRTNWMTVYAADWGSTTAEKVMPHPLRPDQPPLCHGVLTHALLRGLKTAADDQGRVTAATLKQFVRAVMSREGEVNRAPAKVMFDDEQPMLQFGSSEGADVTVSLSAVQATLEVLDGEKLVPLDLVMHATETGTLSLKLKAPRAYLLRSRAADGTVTAERPIHVLQEPLHVEL